MRTGDSAAPARQPCATLEWWTTCDARAGPRGDHRAIIARELGAVRERILIGHAKYCMTPQPLPCRLKKIQQPLPSRLKKILNPKPFQAEGNQQGARDGHKVSTGPAAFRCNAPETTPSADNVNVTRTDVLQQDDLQLPTTAHSTLNLP